jgi:hypothetical protein
MVKRGLEWRQVPTNITPTLGTYFFSVFLKGFYPNFCSVSRIALEQLNEFLGIERDVAQLGGCLFFFSFLFLFHLFFNLGSPCGESPKLEDETYSIGDPLQSISTTQSTSSTPITTNHSINKI